VPIGRVDLRTGAVTEMLTDLRRPYGIKAIGDKRYFVEFGTEAGRYHDGRLSILDRHSGALSVLADDLTYPVRLFVDAGGDIYVLENGGTGTIFGGNDRLIRFPAGSSDYEVVIPNVVTPGSFVIDSTGRILVGSWGQSIPGNTGKLLAYAPGSIVPETLATDLPAVRDMTIDDQDNIYIAGNGGDGAQIALGVIHKGAHELLPLQKESRALSLAFDPSGNLFFSTGTSIRVLPRCGEAGRQLPGDLGQDGALDLSDVIWLLGYLYLGTQPSFPCTTGDPSHPSRGDLALVDVNGDGGIDLSDGVAILSYLLGCPAPRPRDRLHADLWLPGQMSVTSRAHVAKPVGE
jgi:hypothetical protein